MHKGEITAVRGHALTREGETIISTFRGGGGFRTKIYTPFFAVQQFLSRSFPSNLLFILTIYLLSTLVSLSFTPPPLFRMFLLASRQQCHLHTFPS
jgi:hypothetical protein